jgi:hypothetical protein
VTPTAAKPYALPGHLVLSEPKLRFSGDPRDAIDVHPLRGLINHGPFSRDKLSAVSDPIRLAVIAPQGGVKRIADLVHELHQSHKPRERRNYLLDFPGFSSIFYTRLVVPNGPTSIELPATLTTEVQRSPNPHVLLAEALTRSLYALRNLRHDFDIVTIYLSKQWEAGFQELATEEFDLHDCLKAIAASEGICVQIVTDTDTGALGYFCRCSVAWRLGIAFYTKAGDVPWVADSEPGTAFIGIDYALRPGIGTENRYAICCSQVFDAEESGLEFIAYEAEGIKLFGRNPFLRRDQMMKVIARSLAIYQRKHAGQFPRRVVVQKNTEFKPYEVDGCFDALMHTPNVELLHVQQSCGWRGDDLCREVLALSKMDWNNDGPYDRLPVTLSFAQMLAKKVVKRMPKLEPRSYAFRLFM